MRKKQHYVPQMVLKNFAIPSKSDKCWEYNLYTRNILERRIEDVCASRYLYEIRDENGQFFYPLGKNAMEKGLSQIEDMYSFFFEEMFQRLKKEDDYLLENDMIESIHIWISLMILRNPVILQALPDVAKELGVSIGDKIAQSSAFISMISKGLEWVVKDLKQGHIQFLRAPITEGFVIADIPVIFKKSPIHYFCFTPISKEYAILIEKPKSVLLNTNKCKKRYLTHEELRTYNGLIYQAMLNAFDSKYLNGASILSHDIGVLRKVVTLDMI